MTTPPPQFSKAPLTSTVARRAAAAVLACAIVGSASADPGDDVFTLIRRDLTRQQVRIAEINDRAIVHLEAAGWTTVKMEECLALVRSGDAGQRPFSTRAEGMLILSDGQRLPGQVVSLPNPAADAVAWEHPEFGRLVVPLSMVAVAKLQLGAELPKTSDADVVLLANGDTVDGFVETLGDPIRIEREDGQGRRTIEVPLSRVSAVSMVSTARPVKGKRLWLEDGTVMDVSTLTAGDDGYVHIASTIARSEPAPGRTDERGVRPSESTSDATMELGDVRAILLEPAGATALSGMTATRVEGPATRFDVPRPRALDEAAPLDVSRLEMRGPMVARYTLPRGSRRFAAEIELPAEASDWGDYEVVVKCDDRELARERLNGARPRVSINVPLEGAELTIEMTQGANGAIQDVMVLEMAMIGLASGDESRSR